MTYYEILEVNEHASKEVIHMAYKALCKKYHPDVFSGDKKFAEEQMKKINAAYDVLSDDVKRKEYDEYLKGQKNNKQDNEQIDISKKTSKFQIDTKKKVIISIILSILLVAIIVGILLINSVYQNNSNKEKKDETNYSNDNTVENNYTNNDDEQSFAEWSDENKEKSDFLDEYIVFIVEGFDDYYYTYDQMAHVTQQMEEYEFWAYNKEQAIALDYVASNIDVSDGRASEKADFLDECIVFVIDGFGNYYYTYDEMMALTQDVGDYEFWAYNKEAAISNGYKPPSNSTNSTPSANNAKYMQDDYEYKSTCLAVGCDNSPNNLNFYCSEHACAKSGCTSEKSYSSSFCIFHKCDSIGCDNGRNDLGDYCSEHACADSGCSREKTFSGNYCSWHECNYAMCENKAKEYGSYCREHECADPYCSSQKSALSDYCYIHDD